MYRNKAFITLLTFVFGLSLFSGCAVTGDEDSSSEELQGAVPTGLDEESFGTTRSEFSSKNAALTTKENVQVTFKNLDEAMDFLSDSVVIDQVMDMMPFGESEESSCMMVTPDGEEMPCDEGPSGDWGDDEWDDDGNPGFGPGDGPELPEPSPEDGFDMMDTDSDGSLSSDEFMGNQEDFDMLDKNKDGKISLDEFMSMMDFEGEGGDNPPEFEDGPGNERWEEEDDEGVDMELDEMGDDLVEFLEDHLFVDSQVESDENGTVVYLLNPEIFCASDEPTEPLMDMPEQGFGPEGQDFEGGDMERFEGEDGDDGDICSDFLAEMPVRLRFTSSEPGTIQVALLFGEDKDNPIRFEMNPTLVAVELDFGAMMKVVEAITEMMNEDGDDDSEGMEAEAMDDSSELLPKNIEGVVRLSLEKTGDKKLQAALQILESLIVEVEDGTDLYKIQVDASLFSAEVDGALEQIGGTFNLGTVTVTAPFATMVDMMSGECDEEPRFPSMEEGEMGNMGGMDEMDDCGNEEPSDAEGTLKLTLSGLTMSATLNGEGEEMTVTGMGLGSGTSSLKLDSTTLATVDLNSDTGRVFDLSMKADDDETMHISFVPQIDLSILLNFQSVAKEFDDIPEWAMDETMNLFLGDATKPTLAFLDDDKYEGGAVMVEEGTFSLSSTAAPDETVTVSAGSCILGDDDDDEHFEGEEEPQSEEGHEILSSLKSGACPSLQK